MSWLHLEDIICKSTGYFGRRAEEIRDDSEAPRISRTDERRSRSRRRTDGASHSRREKSNYDANTSTIEKEKVESGTSRSKSNRENRKVTLLETPKRLNTDRRIVKLQQEQSQAKVVKVDLPFNNQAKLDAILNFFPTLKSCCCWNLKTGCLIIGWSQVIGCLLVGGAQMFIALVCLEKINLDDFFNNFPPHMNPAKTVSEFADDFCAGLSIGYASGEFIGFCTGIMMLVGIFTDQIFLLRLWAYVAIMMLLPTVAFYCIAIYAVLQYTDDVPVIAVPSVIELISFVVLCYCTSVVKSYYFERIDYLLMTGQKEPIYLQVPPGKPPQDKEELPV